MEAFDDLLNETHPGALAEYSSGEHEIDLRDDVDGEHQRCNEALVGSGGCGTRQGSVASGIDHGSHANNDSVHKAIEKYRKSADTRWNHITR